MAAINRTRRWDGYMDCCARMDGRLGLVGWSWFVHRFTFGVENKETEKMERYFSYALLDAVSTNVDWARARCGDSSDLGEMWYWIVVHERHHARFGRRFYFWGPETMSMWKTRGSANRLQLINLSVVFCYYYRAFVFARPNWSLGLGKQRKMRKSSPLMQVDLWSSYS